MLVELLTDVSTISCFPLTFIGSRDHIFAPILCLFVICLDFFITWSEKRGVFFGTLKDP